MLNISAFSTPFAWVLATFRNFIAPVVIAAISLILYRSVDVNLYRKP